VIVLAALMAETMRDANKVGPVARGWAVFTWVWLLCGEVLTQLPIAARDAGFGGGVWAAPAAQLVGLFTVLVYGPLFVLGEIKRERIHEQEADVGTQEFREDTVKLSGDKEYEGVRGTVGGL